MARSSGRKKKLSRGESKILAGTSAAFDRFNAANMAYLNAIIFLLEIESIAKDSASVKEVYSRFEKATANVQQDARTYFRCSLFAVEISAMELFLQDVMKSVILEHPKKIGGLQFRLSEVLDFKSQDELLTRAAEEFQNRVMYKKPMEYLDEIVALLSIDRKPLEKPWKVFVEAKARRDLGVHNRWICNDTYVRKVRETGAKRTARIGTSLTPVDRAYLFRVSSALTKIVASIFKQVAQTYP
jgi:hypothetical protein